MYYRHGAYYLVKRGDWRRLSASLPEALEIYARMIDADRRGGGMVELIDKAFAAMTPDLKPNTVAQHVTDAS